MMIQAGKCDPVEGNQSEIQAWNSQPIRCRNCLLFTWLPASLSPFRALLLSCPDEGFGKQVSPCPFPTNTFQSPALCPAERQSLAGEMLNWEVIAVLSPKRIIFYILQTSPHLSPGCINLPPATCILEQEEAWKPIWNQTRSLACFLLRSPI